MALGDFAKLIKGITLIAGAATGSYWLGTTLFPGATRSGFESTRYEAVPVSASAQVAAGTVETAPRMNTAAATAAPVPTPAHAAAPAATPAPDPAPAEAGALPAADFTVHTQKPARPISDLIYGANFHAENAETHTTELAYPIVRWGGNHTSRYNWRANIANRGADCSSSTSLAANTNAPASP